MAGIRTAVLVAQATGYAYRADDVRRDPAVVKAFAEFRHDGAQFLRSSGKLASEARLAWRRSDASARKPRRDDDGLSSSLAW